ncbi:hypothetical protein GUJ93_ZPchr0003g18136 [Zizania palustris]|uniref:Ninja-family protein n=1 Tax=Zizania palustris TaxID=103762 RepID=A0A8J5SWB2_ZIZPA|nr:hypothetical protein GUJ93_ZPchr0003g18136 [Zizania palustris]
MASRDFLGDFGGGGKAAAAAAAADGSGSAAGAESDEIELSLGLSLGGRFGTDMSPEAKRARLARSSSIASVCSVSDADGDPSPAAPLPLLRTSSLPTETEEERRRRRETQNRRRLEARRKRLERRISAGSSSGPGKPGREDGGDGIVNRLPLRRSIGSQGSSSAKPQDQGPDGSAVCQATETRSPSTSDDTNHNSALPPTATTGKPLNGTMTQQPPLRTLGSLTMRTSSTGDIRKIMMEDMPMVSSKVEGPNSRKIDGFLYRYKKGEDVRIVCVCHGNFLTPAEFVKHAGGEDVSNPLRHIVVNPSPSLFL